ncbi:MAG TPA: succinate dehydrogenase [Azospirillaceae bacterium]|nr:succinate dehydrogenase [Azospirillaceae bacterium]
MFDVRSRSHPTYLAFVVHRLSGLVLTLFLPAHFWALSRAIQGEAVLEGFLRWTDHSLVKAVETLLVLALAAHTASGLRLMALEFLGWRRQQKTLVAVSAGVTMAVGLGFLLNVY